MNASPNTALQENEPSDTAQEDDGRTPGAPETSAHEQLLIRHGLVSHIIEFDISADDAHVEGLLRDTSRLATNTIRIGPRRFGVLFEESPPESLGDAEFVVAIKPVDLARSAGDDVGAEANKDTVDEQHPSTAETNTSSHDQGVHADTLSRIEAQLEALTARIDEVSPSAVADQIVPVVDELVTRRIEAEDRARSETAEIREGWKNDIAQFWEGMEAVLRLLSGSANEVLDAGKTLLDAVPEPHASTTSEAQTDAGENLASLLQTLAENQVSTENGLAAIDASLAVTAGDQAEAISALRAEVATASVAQIDAIAQSDSRRTSSTKDVAARLSQIETGMADLRSAQSAQDSADYMAAIDATWNTIQAKLDALSEAVSGLATTRDAETEPKNRHSVDDLQEGLQGLERLMRGSERLMSALARDVGTLLARPVPAEPPAPPEAPDLGKIVTDLSERLAATESNLLSSLEASSGDLGQRFQSNEVAIAAVTSALGELDTTQHDDAFAKLHEDLAEIGSRQIESDAFARQMGRAIAEGLAQQLLHAPKTRSKH